MKKRLLTCLLALCLALPLCAHADGPAPDFSARDQYGQTWTLSALRGKVVLLHFWTSWYAWCERDLAELEACLRELGQNQGKVIVLGVASPGQRDSATEAGLRTLLAAKGISCPVLMDTSGSVFSAYAPADLPTTYPVSPSGELLGYVPGAVERNTLREMVRIASGE